MTAQPVRAESSARALVRECRRAGIQRTGRLRAERSGNAGARVTSRGDSRHDRAALALRPTPVAWLVENATLTLQFVDYESPPRWGPRAAACPTLTGRETACPASLGPRPDAERPCDRDRAGDRALATTVASAATLVRSRRPCPRPPRRAATSGAPHRDPGIRGFGEPVAECSVAGDGRVERLDRAPRIDSSIVSSLTLEARTGVGKWPARSPNTAPPARAREAQPHLGRWRHPTSHTLDPPELTRQRQDRRTRIPEPTLPPAEDAGEVFLLARPKGEPHRFERSEKRARPDSNRRRTD